MYSYCGCCFWATSCCINFTILCDWTSSGFFSICLISIIYELYLEQILFIVPVVWSYHCVPCHNLCCNVYQNVFNVHVVTVSFTLCNKQKSYLITFANQTNHKMNMLIVRVCTCVRSNPKYSWTNHWILCIVYICWYNFFIKKYWLNCCYNYHLYPYLWNKIKCVC